MTPIKLKLTNLKDGQESLLLVTKINMKGVLVQAASTLPTGTPVKLRLQFSSERFPIEAQAEVYKVAQNEVGQKGMILRFVNPSREFLTKISPHVSAFEQSLGESFGTLNLGHKTQMVEPPAQ